MTNDQKELVDAVAEALLKTLDAIRTPAPEHRIHTAIVNIAEEFEVYVPGFNKTQFYVDSGFYPTGFVIPE